MAPTITVLTSGLKLLSFQGITTYCGKIMVATIEGDLVRIEPDGKAVLWVNVARYGIPTGIVGWKDTLVVALSAQETGHFLIQATPQGKLSVLADLSALAGEFGAPFSVAAYDGYYPYYLVAISTDVVGSAGLIAKVTRSGNVSVLATLPKSPFGVEIGPDYAIASQEDGHLLKIDSTGSVSVIGNLAPTQLGSPLDLTRFESTWMMTTTTGWLAALSDDGTLTPRLNLVETGVGAPTTLTTINSSLVVATQTGNLVKIEFEENLLP
jgi:hypothetical protein